MGKSPRRRSPRRRSRTPLRRSPVRTHSKRYTPRSLRKSPRKSPRRRRKSKSPRNTRMLGLETAANALTGANRKLQSASSAVKDAYSAATTRGAMAIGALAGNTDVVKSGMKHLDTVKSRSVVDGDVFYDSDNGSSSRSASKADEDIFHDSDDGSQRTATTRSSIEKDARQYIEANPYVSVLNSGITSYVPPVRLSDPAAIWNMYNAGGGKSDTSLIDVRRAQDQRMLVKTAPEVRKVSESLENINDVLYHTGKRRAKIVALDSPMTAVFGADAAKRVVRLILPPTQSDDSLHVARLFRYVLAGEKNTLKSFVIHLRAFYNMNKTNMVLRTDRTPKSPRSGENPVSVRSLDTIRNELYVLLGIYDCNVMLVINRNGSPKIETLRFVHMANNWVILYVNRDNHIEVICEALEDDVIRVAFSPENPLFTSMMAKLDFNPKRPTNIFSTKKLLA